MENFRLKVSSTPHVREKISLVAAVTVHQFFSEQVLAKTPTNS